MELALHGNQMIIMARTRSACLRTHRRWAVAVGREGERGRERHRARWAIANGTKSKRREMRAPRLDYRRSRLAAVGGIGSGSILRTDQTSSI